MPPWKADPTFLRYKNERLLRPHEINLIKVWVENGAPQGDQQKAPSAPTLANNPHLNLEPDLVLKDPYEISKRRLRIFASLAYQPIWKRMYISRLFSLNRANVATCTIAVLW